MIEDYIYKLKGSYVDGPNYIDYRNISGIKYEDTNYFYLTFKWNIPQIIVSFNYTENSFEKNQELCEQQVSELLSLVNRL